MILYFSSVKRSHAAYVNYGRNFTLYKQVLTTEGKVSCSRKQLEPLIWFELTFTDYKYNTLTTEPSRPLVFINVGAV